MTILSARVTSPRRMRRRNNFFIMFKKAAAVLLALMLIGCAGTQNQPAEGGGTAEQEQTAPSEDGKGEETQVQPGDGAAGGNAGGSEAAGQESAGSAALGATKKEDTVTIVIPRIYESITSQEEADEICQKNGYVKAVLREDGSLEITMSRAKQQELISDFQKSVDQGIGQIEGSESYPSVSRITYNEDYSVFTVETGEEEIGIAERQLAQELIMYGTFYHVYSGLEEETIRVDFVNKDTGEVIGSADSGSSS